MRIAVGDSVLDLEREVLLDASGGVVELRPQAFQVLRHLALEAGRLVSKDQLLAAVWPDVVVTDDSLVQAIGDVRRALGPRGRDVVRTIPRRGYLLVAHPLPAEPVAAGLPPPLRPFPDRSHGRAWRCSQRPGVPPWSWLVWRVCRSARVDSTAPVCARENRPRSQSSRSRIRKAMPTPSFWPAAWPRIW